MNRFSKQSIRVLIFPVFTSRNAINILPKKSVPAVQTVILIIFEWAKYRKVAPSRITNRAVPSNNLSKITEPKIFIFFSCLILPR